VEYVIGKTPQNYYRHGGQHSSAPRGGAAPAPTGERVVVTANSLNVRSGPGTSNPAQFSLVSGAIVNVLSRSNGWVQVQDDQGRTGWISEQFTATVQ